MSSTVQDLWPIVTRCMIAAAALTIALPAQAQSKPEHASKRDADDETVVIDLLAEARELYGPEEPFEDCTAEQEAAIISGEIIVCRRKQDQSRFRATDPNSAESRYAQETAYANDPQAPNVDGEGITGRHALGGGKTFSGLCVIPPCPKEPALIIDVTALPEAPPGSDADRIARGLPPLGNDDGNGPSQAELIGEPDKPVTLTTGNVTQDRKPTSPEGSAEPEED